MQSPSPEGEISDGSGTSPVVPEPLFFPRLLRRSWRWSSGSGEALHLAPQTDAMGKGGLAYLAALSIPRSRPAKKRPPGDRILFRVSRMRRPRCAPVLFGCA